MANEEHTHILRQGLEHWNQWRKAYPRVKPDLRRLHLSRAKLSQVRFGGARLSGAILNEAVLSEADLHKANLSGAKLSGANLSGANLRRAFLNGADLRGANLSGANLSGANLTRGDLRGALLSGVNLRGAILHHATLNQANLREADLSGARVGWTAFWDVDLSGVKGLETVKHEGPSYIDILAIYRSQGDISQPFLRGAGIPDSFIIYMKSLTGTAFDFYSCFISYSSEDEAFAERLHADLQAKGVRCWYAPEDIQGGKKIHEQIDHAIRLHDKLLIVLSEHSMNSEWVKTEVYHARQQEAKEQRRKLFPISLVEYDTVRQWQAFDADLGKDMAREVREYFIPDFSHWKDHDAYRKAFARLLRDLKAEG